MRARGLRQPKSAESGTCFGHEPTELEPSDSKLTLTLRNGGFEVGDLWPIYWLRGRTGYDDFTFQWHGVEGWKGARAVSISRQTAADAEFGYWAQTIPAHDFRGGSATLRVWIKSDLEGEGVSLVIRGDDVPGPSGDGEVGQSTQGEVPITGLKDWTEYRVTLNEVPSRIESLTVYLLFLPNTTRTVYFDEVSLTP